MKSFKNSTDLEDSLLERPISEKINRFTKYIPYSSIIAKKDQKRAHKAYKKLHICLGPLILKQRDHFKHTLTRISSSEELILIIQQEYWKIQRFIYALANLRLRKVHLIIESPTIFDTRKLKNILSRFFTKRILKLTFAIKGPSSLLDFLNMNRNGIKFTNKHFSVISHQLRSLSLLQELEINHSAQSVSLTEVSLTSLATSLTRFRRLSSLKLRINLKDMTDKSANYFAQSLTKQKNIKALDLSLSGFRTVCTENLFAGISRLSNLELFKLEIDCGWNEISIQDLANCCGQLLNLKHFYMIYSPSQRMAYNPLFRQSLNKLTQLQFLKLVLTSLAGEELFELFDSLQYLIQLQKLKLSFVCTDFNTKNIRRLSDSIAKLENLSSLCLDFTQCTFPDDSMTILCLGLEHTHKLIQLRLSLIRCKGGVGSNVLNEIFEVLKQAEQLDTLHFTLRNQDVSNFIIDLTSMSNFIQHHKELKVFEINLPAPVLNGMPRKVIDDFEKKFQKKNFVSFYISTIYEAFFECYM